MILMTRLSHFSCISISINILSFEIAVLRNVDITHKRPTAFSIKLHLHHLYKHVRTAATRVS